MCRKTVLMSVKEYFIIAVGILIYVCGWSIFLVPNNLVGGGVSGLSSIVQYATGIRMGYTYFVVNAALMVVALKILGRGFGGKTIFAIILASIGLNVMQSVIPTGIVNAIAVENGKLMSTIMGGIMVGIGIGMTMSVGGSTGGTDIIALIVNKYRNVSPGRMILAMDFVVILSSMVVPSYTSTGVAVGWVDKITTVVYGLVLVTINSYVLDLYLSGTKQSVQVFILSHQYDKIADGITHDFHRGVTVLPAQGWYTKQESHVLMVMTRKHDLNFLLRYIKSVDSDAFVSVSSVMGVYGKGFDTYKISNKKNTLRQPG